MSNKIISSIETHFSELEDPRKLCLNDHPLINIVTIALCGIIVGAKRWTDIENFGNHKRVGYVSFLT